MKIRPVAHKQVPFRRGAGLTLVELLMVMAIAAILLSSGVPSFVRIVHSVQLSMASNAYLSSLRLARSEAQRRGGRVAVCKSADGASCTTSGGWEQGWIVFHDRNGDGQHNSDDTMIQQSDRVSGSVVFTGTAQLASGLTFTALGGARSTGGGMLAGTLTLCTRADGATPARQVVIASGGRARVQQVMLGRCPS